MNREKGKKTKDKIIDAATTGMVLRPSTRLPDDQGEWIKGEEPEIIDSESLSQEPPPQEEEESAESHDDAPLTEDLYQSFVRQATKIPRLSEEEERALGLKVQLMKDEAAAKKLVVHNMRLAIKMAHQYRRSWTSLMDLVQEASAGLAIAAKRWDPDMGTRFGTYAAYWIRAQLTKFLMTNSRLIHTGNTRAGRKVYHALPSIRRKLLAEGKTPTAELIAKEVHEDPEEVSIILRRLEGREASLSAPLDNDNESTLQDTLSSIG